MMTNAQGANHLTITEQAKAVFEDLKRMKDSVEYWSARELMPALGYRSWQKFEGVLDRAQVACFNSGFNPEDHFIGADKMVETGSGAKRELVDYHLSRYACYLVAQNGDPRKPAIAAAQSYFAIKTHQAETANPAQQRLDVIERSMVLLEKLGVLDDATRRALEREIHEILSTLRTAPTTQLNHSGVMPERITIEERAAQLGLQLDTWQAVRAAGELTVLCRRRWRKDPPTIWRVTDDLSLMDEAIRANAEQPALEAGKGGRCLAAVKG